MLFDHAEYDHEQVLFCADRASGLRAIIAIHDRTLGPAAGGCRMRPYASEEEALTDVLRLSQGMTRKNALAGLPLGGGKSVIIADPGTDKTPELLRAFAGFVAGLGGSYWTAEDIGMGAADIEELARHCNQVFGTTSVGQHTGDPSAYTAAGCFAGLKACVDRIFGSPDLTGRTVAIQGVGNVGLALGRLLIDAGAQLVVADTATDSVRRAVRELGATAVEVDQISTVECDVLAPCAVGATLNATSIPQLRTPIVCGVANNQLATTGDGESLHRQGILYAPDYVVNAGGMLNASGDILGSHDPGQVAGRIDHIGEVMGQIADRSKAEDRPTNLIADELADEVVRAARG